MKTESVTFPGASGAELSGRLESPEGTPRAYALFAHCFACGKDILAATRISRALGAAGIATLRFDFTGLGQSGGVFAETGFVHSVEDMIAAADWLRRERAAPALIVGHSLGGAAALAAAGRIAEAKAVATINAPFDPGHVKNLFGDKAEEIRREGAATIRLGERDVRIGRGFFDALDETEQKRRIAELERALLVIHAPRDAIVGIDNAAQIFVTARHPKSFLSLDDADHMLSRPEDASYAAAVIVAWASRWLPADEAAPVIAAVEGAVVVAETGHGRFQQDVVAGPHRLHADEPAGYGGADTGMSPYQFLAAGLGACTSMTMRMYADRKGWPLERVRVVLRHDKAHGQDGEAPGAKGAAMDRIRREIEMEGPLDAEQRARLLEIADKCPVHRTLHAGVKVETSAIPPKLDAAAE